MKYALEMKGVCKSYKDTKILDDINIKIPKGAICGLVGENGAGKSTLMKLIAGTSFASSGSIIINGKKAMHDNHEQRRNMGFLIEYPTVYYDMNARENLEIQRTLRGIPGKGCIEEVLNAVKLENVGNTRVGKFSLGMKQRLGIAIAMLGEPDFLILDEPINGLDPEKIRYIREFLQKMNEEHHTTILISSHILEELSQLATMYCFIHKGKILESLTREEMEIRCQTHLSIKVNETSKVCALLERQKGISDMSIGDDGSIKVFERFERPQDIAKCIVENGFELYELTIKHETLENYYMKLLVSAQSRGTI